MGHAPLYLNARASATDFVEQQMPLVDAQFLVWLFDRLGTDFVEMQDALGTDWGIDELWCGAAAEYAATVLGTPNRTACAVLVEPIDHFGTRSINKSKANVAGMRLNKGGKAMRKYAKLRFPAWFRPSSGDDAGTLQSKSFAKKMVRQSTRHRDDLVKELLRSVAPAPVAGAAARHACWEGAACGRKPECQLGALPTDLDKYNPVGVTSRLCTPAFRRMIFQGPRPHPSLLAFRLHEPADDHAARGTAEAEGRDAQAALRPFWRVCPYGAAK